MTEISTEELSIARSADKVFNFLKDLRNFENLMPSEVDFSATETEAQLDLKGLGKFSITLAEQEASSRIMLQPEGKLPFKFNIEWLISEKGETSSVVGRINAELNMFMKMMAEPKLKSFIEKQAYKLKEYLESEIS